MAQALSSSAGVTLMIGVVASPNQAESELQRRLVAESHAKEGDSFVNDHVAGDEEPIRGLHIL
jgi:hypothetical protein